MSDPASKSEAMFLTWAPDEGLWTPWAKPVIFNNRQLSGFALFEMGDPVSLFPPERLGIPAALGRAVLVVDLPGVRSVTAGLALADEGYRPVPLYNGCDGRGAIVTVEGVALAVAGATDRLRTKNLPLDAPPAFLLDSDRMSGYASPGKFDNRWMVFPQDFPSANFLLSRRYQQAIVISDQGGAVQEDLKHVLLRWQDAGLQIRSFSFASRTAEDIVVQKPWQYKLFFYRALAKIGLRPNSAGGFGDYVPVPSETSYGGYG
jgi:hypothetical protein